jgi:hypothetical protein
MDKARVTPKDFFLWAGAMVALYWSVISFIFLVFNYIDYTYPDALSYTPTDPYQSGVGHEMASIIVLFPLYLVLMWFIRRDMHQDPSRKTIWVRRWALILTIFVTGVTIAVDLITLLTAFFNGTALTEAFLFKVALVLLIAAAGFMHFTADLWGYWDEYPERKRAVGIGVGILAVLTIVAGFFIIGTPMQASANQFDEQKVSDLQTIQNEVIMYWQEEGKLPVSLAALSNSTSGVSVPVDEQTGQPYGYDVLGKLGFKLCATFNAVTPAYAMTQNELTMPQAAPIGGSGVQYESDSWYHEAGTQCFTRAIDPARYPSVKPQ